MKFKVPIIFGKNWWNFLSVVGGHLKKVRLHLLWRGHLTFIDSRFLTLHLSFLSSSSKGPSSEALPTHIYNMHTNNRQDVRKISSNYCGFVITRNSNHFCLQSNISSKRASSWTPKWRKVWATDVQVSSSVTQFVLATCTLC